MLVVERIQSNMGRDWRVCQKGSWYTHSEPKFASRREELTASKRSTVGDGLVRNPTVSVSTSTFEIEEPFTDAYVASLLYGDGGPIN